MDRYSFDPLGAIRAGVSRVESVIRRSGSEVISRCPLARAPVLALWCQYMLAYGAAQAKVTELRSGHRAPIDPFSVVSVDPDRIEYLVEDDGYPNQIRDESAFPPPKFKHAGRVVGGDWDERTHRFEETDLYRGFESRFKRSVRWEETAFYRRSVAYIEDGVKLWGCETERDFRRRCTFVESLYESIDRDGYRSQSALSDTPADTPGDGPKTVETVTDEITVCIGRDGDFLFMDGRNRLAIAKVLELDSVPVWIMARHERWQRTRDRVAADPARRGALPERSREHPDLDDLSPDLDGS